MSPRGDRTCELYQHSTRGIRAAAAHTGSTTLTSYKNPQDKRTFLRYHGGFCVISTENEQCKVSRNFSSFPAQGRVQDVLGSFCIGWLKRQHTVLPPPLTGVLHYCKKTNRSGFLTVFETDDKILQHRDFTSRPVQGRSPECSGVLLGWLCPRSCPGFQSLLFTLTGLSFLLLPQGQSYQNSRWTSPTLTGCRQSLKVSAEDIPIITNKKPNSITLASSELAPNMSGASSELVPNMFGASSQLVRS